MSETTTYNVTGMTCGHCVGSVEKAVGAIQGVESVSVDLASGSVTVVATSALDRSVVAAAVDDAGYELVS